jgi:hypothetical protein
MEKLKNLFSYISFVSLIMMHSSCKENANILLFESNSAYIYFAQPPGPDALASNELYPDSLNFTFTLEPSENKLEKVLEIPVKVAGKAIPKAREFKVELDPEKSTIQLSLVKIESSIIEADSINGVVRVRIKNDAILRTGRFFAQLKMVDNEYFRVGHQYNSKIRIGVSDILNQPHWWDVWYRHFGDYYFEKFEKWIEIYYLGADPSPEFYEPHLYPGPYYYWGRMPEIDEQFMFPITFMYISKLKKYFEDNEVYPDGDKTKPRIKLP